VLSFTTGSLALSRTMVEGARLFHICVSFGSVNSTISLPGSMSHASVPAEIRKLRQLPEDLVRVSVGIEDVDDLIMDLDQALNCGGKATGATETRVTQAKAAAG
jgi:cystathionine beta-lyase